MAWQKNHPNNNNSLESSVESQSLTFDLLLRCLILKVFYFQTEQKVTRNRDVIKFPINVCLKGCCVKVRVSNAGGLEKTTVQVRIFFVSSPSLPPSHQSKCSDF